MSTGDGMEVMIGLIASAGAGFDDHCESCSYVGVFLSPAIPISYLKIGTDFSLGVHYEALAVTWTPILMRATIPIYDILRR